MNKLIISILLMVGLVGMIGTAAANPFNLNIVGGPNPLVLDAGQSVILDLEGNTFHSDDVVANQYFTLTSSVSCVTPGCNIGDIQVAFSPSTFGPATNPTITNANIMTVTRISSPIDQDGTQYLIEVTAGPDSATDEYGVSTRSVTAVPEFQTIALPIAAVIGLMFILGSRKKKE